MDAAARQACERPIVERDLTRVLRRQAAENPEKTWIVAGEERLSFAAAAALSEDLAARFAAAGLAAGETALVMLPNGVEFVLVWCALARLGALEVPLNTQLKGGVLEHQIRDSRARIAVVESAFLADFLAANREGGAVEQVILLGEPPAGLQAEGVAIVPWQAFYQAPAPPALTVDPPGYRDLIAVMYTSGTTGPSKGCMITHAHAYEYAHCVVELLELTEPTIVYYNVLAVVPHRGAVGRGSTRACRSASPATVVVPPVFSAWGGSGTDVPGRHERELQLVPARCHGATGFMAVQPASRSDDADNPMERMLVVPLLPEVEGLQEALRRCLVSTTWGSTEINVPTRSGFDLADNKTCGRRSRGSVRGAASWTMNDMEVPRRRGSR